MGQSTGQICLGLLKPDQWNTESRIRTLLVAISVALVQPQEDSYVDDEVYHTYKQNKRLYEERARKSAKK